MCRDVAPLRQVCASFVEDAAFGIPFTRGAHRDGMRRALVLLFAAGVMAWPSPALSAPGDERRSVLHGFADERAVRLAALGAAVEAGDDAAVRAEGRALAALYWENGLLPEAAAALELAHGAAADAEPLHQLAMMARGLAPEQTEASLRDGAVADLSPMAAYVTVGHAAETGHTLTPAALEAALRGAPAAPAWARARYAPALTEAAAAAGSSGLARRFAALTAQASSPPASKYAEGRAAEAANDVDAALSAYAQAVGRGRWPAMARLRTAALLWAEGRATPSETARTLETLLVDWPGEHMAAAALTALGRAYLFAGEPISAAHALSVVAERRRGGVHDALARRAADRLDALLEAVFVENRYPELDLGRRVDLFARARPHAATPLGGLAADAAHLDALLAADLLEEVVALTEVAPDALPERRDAALAGLEADAAAGQLLRADLNDDLRGGPRRAFDFTPYFAPPPPPRLAPEPLPAVQARAALDRLETGWSALERAVEALESTSDLSGAPS